MPRLLYLSCLSAIALAVSACQPKISEVPPSTETNKIDPMSLISMTTFGGEEAEGFHDCFWIGPVSYDSYNIAYPDEGAVYWGTSFQIPENASHIEIEGSYPKARYFSYNSYNIRTQPTGVLTDTQLEPFEGANPFTSADKSGGQYRVKVFNGDAPDDPFPNTIYLGRDGNRNPNLPLILRIYLPETDNDYTGGAGLPKTRLIMKDGATLKGADMCAAINSPAPGSGARVFPTVVIEPETYRELINQPGTPLGFPASPTPEWTKFWGGDISVSRYIPDQLYFKSQIARAEAGERPKSSGFYANIDNEYVSTFVNEAFGDLVVLEGKLPTTPRNGWDITSDTYDLRYWSLCTNEHIATTRYADCLYDEEVTIDDARNYRIVVSKIANRPENARAECGVSWIDWGEFGDGAGDLSQGNLIVRNMLGDGFAHSIQSVATPTSVEADMGDYAPKITYWDKDEFESLGCKPTE